MIEGRRGGVGQMNVEVVEEEEKGSVLSRYDPRQGVCGRGAGVPGFGLGDIVQVEAAIEAVPLSQGRGIDDAAGSVAPCLEDSCKGRHRRCQHIGDGQGAVLARVQRRQNGSEGGRRPGRLAYHALEENPATRQRIDLGTGGAAIAIAPR